MKTKRFFIRTSLVMVLFLNLFLALNAQLKVLPSGRVEIPNQLGNIGTVNNDMLDLVNHVTNLAAGYDIIWANYVSTQPNNPGLLSLATAYSNKFIVKANGWIGISNINPSCELDVTGTGRINGSLILTSDERLKENVSPLTSTSASLLKLSGVQYNLKYTTEDLFFGDKQELLMKDSVYFRKNEMGENFYNRKRFGFLAQDVKAVFPELVFQDSFGIMSIDYLGLIPVMIETLKEQQQQIDMLQTVMLNQELEIIKIKELIGIKAQPEGDKKSSQTTDFLNGADEPILYQNSPNPFNVKTTIELYLPESATNAVLFIHDLNGIEIRATQLTGDGIVKVEINANTLKKGMYLYSLVVDGKQVESKRMILTD
jgi:hypothetical protein